MMKPKSSTAVLAITIIFAALSLAAQESTQSGVKFRLKIGADDNAAAAAQTDGTEVVSFSVGRGDDKDKASDGHPLNMVIATDETLSVLVDHSVNEQPIKSLILITLDKDGNPMTTCTFKNVTVNLVNVDTTGDTGTHTEVEMVFESMEIKANPAQARHHHNALNRKPLDILLNNK